MYTTSQTSFIKIVPNLRVFLSIGNQNIFNSVLILISNQLNDLCLVSIFRIPMTDFCQLPKPHNNN
ncbi:hypothetical protein CH361_14540 [Leptospira brenneri]|nr:hypothetical protein CH361_14540 [Leptospira brenneri]